MDGSTFNIPEPPEHIKGNLHRFIPQQRRDDRDAWCRLMREAGHTCRVIGKALGITANMAHKASERAGYVTPPKQITYQWLRNRGARMGKATAAFAVLDPKTQAMLIKASFNRRCSIIEATFAMVAEMKKDHPGVK